MQLRTFMKEAADHGLDLASTVALLAKLGKRIEALSSFDELIHPAERYKERRVRVHYKPTSTSTPAPPTRPRPEDVAAGRIPLSALFAELDDEPTTNLSGLSGLQPPKQQETQPLATDETPRFDPLAHLTRLGKVAAQTPKRERPG